MEQQPNEQPISNEPPVNNEQPVSKVPGELEKTSGDSVEKSYNFIYYILGVLEVLLAFRLVLRLLGANPASGFVNFIYDLSGIFTKPFTAIFSRATTEGLETTSVFEPETLIAMVVYALVAFGIVKLLLISTNRKEKV